VASRKDPNNTEVLINKIILLDKLQRPDALSEAESVMQLCDRIINEQPNNPKILVDKAIALDIAKRKEEAIDWYDKALKINPQNAYALYNKSCTMSLLGWDVNEILMVLKNAITFNPTYKNLAKDDKDFEKFKDDERFKELLK
jgi:tetratricopeptide (TPR) repeat protein